MAWRDAAAYVGVQLAFGILGAWAAHAMFVVAQLIGAGLAALAARLLFDPDQNHTGRA